MFKKDLVPGPKTKLKSSAQRAVRQKVCDSYPLLAPYIDQVLPKKEQLDVLKLPDRCTLYTLPQSSGPAEPLFWQHMDDALVPHLRLVHRYPDCFARVRVDRGAIRFVLSGATLMVPGMTSPGGRLPGDGKTGGDEDSSDEEEDEDEDEFDYSGQAEVEAGSVVVVEAEGKKHACAVGVLKMGTAQMKKDRKGVGIEGGHYVGDGLWKMVLD